MAETSYNSLMFNNRDLLEQIFSHFLNDAHGDHGLNKPSEPAVSVTRRDTRRALLRVAFTCKAFSVPALNVLWSVMERLGPLLLLIPGVQLTGGKYVPTDTLTNKSLERFDIYARRIRQLSFFPPRERNIGSSANQILLPLSRLRPAGLLPGLIRLHMVQPLSHETITANSWIIPFVPLTVTTAYLDAADGAGATFIGTLLSVMDAERPHLQHLFFQGRLLPQTMSYIIRFCRLSHLHLTTTIVGEGTLDTISMLKTLTHLEISFKELQDTFVGVTIGMQDSLTNLRLHGPGDDLQTLLSSIIAAHLTTIELRFRASPPPSSIAQCFTRCKSFPSLSRLAFVNNWSPALIEHSFSELFETRLHRLEIRNFFLSDMESSIKMFPLAKNWSNLTTLRLSCGQAPGIPLDPKLCIPLQGLPEIALGCPNLRSLELGVFLRRDATSSGTWDQLKLPISKHRLRDLHVHFVNIKEIANCLDNNLGVAIGGFIYLIFPFLQRMSTSAPAGERTWWGNVFMFIEAYRNLKEKESRISTT